MLKKTALITNTQRKQKLGDRVRSIADQLKYETGVQIKATSRILSAAAQITENHEQLIDEVVDMVEEDLNQQTQVEKVKVYTVAQLKQQFKTLREAKAYFGHKATSWAELANKLSSLSASSKMSTGGSKTLVLERINAIESELKIMHTEIDKILSLLKQFLNQEGAKS